MTKKKLIIRMKETKKFVEKQADFIIGCALDEEWTISQSIKFATNYLRDYDYTEKFIHKVCQMVIDELRPVIKNKQLNSKEN